MVGEAVDPGKQVQRSQTRVGGPESSRDGRHDGCRKRRARPGHSARRVPGSTRQRRAAEDADDAIRRIGRAGLVRSRRRDNVASKRRHVTRPGRYRELAAVGLVGRVVQVAARGGDVEHVVVASRKTGSRRFARYQVETHRIVARRGDDYHTSFGERRNCIRHVGVRQSQQLGHIVQVSVEHVGNLGRARQPTLQQTRRDWNVDAQAEIDPGRGSPRVSGEGQSNRCTIPRRRRYVACRPCIIGKQTPRIRGLEGSVRCVLCRLAQSSARESSNRFARAAVRIGVRSIPQPAGRYSAHSRDRVKKEFRLIRPEGPE
jgi:hypothetical protein